MAYWEYWRGLSAAVSFGWIVRREAWVERHRVINYPHKDARDSLHLDVALQILQQCALLSGTAKVCWELCVVHARWMVGQVVEHRSLRWNHVDRKKKRNIQKLKHRYRKAKRLQILMHKENLVKKRNQRLTITNTLIATNFKRTVLLSRWLEIEYDGVFLARPKKTEC